MWDGRDSVRKDFYPGDLAWCTLYGGFHVRVTQEVHGSYGEYVPCVQLDEINQLPPGLSDKPEEEEKYIPGWENIYGIQVVEPIGDCPGCEEQVPLLRGDYLCQKCRVGVAHDIIESWTPTETTK